jgi:hypothetical protein
MKYFSLKAVKFQKLGKEFLIPFSLAQNEAQRESGGNFMPPSSITEFLCSLSFPHTLLSHQTKESDPRVLMDRFTFGFQEENISAMRRGEHS